MFLSHIEVSLSNPSFLSKINKNIASGENLKKCLKKQQHGTLAFVLLLTAPGAFYGSLTESG